VEFRHGHTPRSGDLIVAAIQKIAQHTRIQLSGGRRSLLYPGDLVVVAYGNRYAPDAFEALVPDDLDQCHLVAAGGVAAVARSKSAGLKWPTSIQPEGFCIGRDGRVINLRDYGLEMPRGPVRHRKPVIAVLGTSMNAGKTTTVASLIRGLTLAGHRVAGIKATGTGAGNDVWAYADAGAARVLDFTDAGYPSTFKLPMDEIIDGFNRLVAAAQLDPGVDLAVVEIADGLLQRETAKLVASEAFRTQVDHVLFAAGEAMGALAGVKRLARLGIETTALSGRLTASRLACREARRATRLPILTKAKLEAPRVATLIGS
jgi:molybdopterin-guanine dinucleotide biosynthesis protein